MKYLIIILLICIYPTAFSQNVIPLSSPDKTITGKSIQTIESKSLTVSLDITFPRIIQYKWNSNGNLLYGQEDQLSQVVINGKSYTPEITFTKSKSVAEYLLQIPQIGIMITIQIKVTNNILEFGVNKITENSEFRVSTFEIPNHNLLSVRSTQNGASFAGTKMFTAIKGSGDDFLSLSDVSVIDSIPKNYLYGIVNDQQLAGSIWSNSVTEKTDNSRIQKQTVKKEGYYRTGIWSGSWIYRAQGMKTTDPLPVAKMVITADANNDQLVDWQDGAIAFRSITNNPMGSEKIPELVVQRIPMNFASQATNPFTKTLDETKRIYLNTDGLGQFVILKGYGSEGHDSAHPEYGDIGKRQGGATAMELLCKEAQKYNAFMGVHINGTESYPEAKSFDDSLVNKSKKGWDWLDASYYIDKRRDATTNNRMVRLQSLKDQVPSLNFIYCDVWYAGGSWDSKKLGREIHSLGLTLATEFPSDHESDAVWNHWAVDYDYGGKNIKGFNSQIVRFIRNHQKDTWIARHPILGGEEMKDFEGWQGRNNLDSCIRMTFKTGLPTKYLQHFPILKWEDQSITFENKVVASIINGERIITKDKRIILKDNSYLIPWNPLTEDKFYHWNGVAGSTTWSLPESWSKLKSVMLYQLSDQGKTFIQNLPVLNGQITIQANANTPYVIYKKKAAEQLPMKWGEGTLIKDPGFNSGNLTQWNVVGSGASVQRNGKGQYELAIADGNGAEVSQTISGLTPGTYYASVYAAVEGNRKATMGVDISGDSTVRVFCNSSLWKNYIAADSKSGTTMQRMYLFFRIPTGQNNARLFLKADGGPSKVYFDDLRLTVTNHPLKSDSLYFTEDFENIPDGLYPFIKGSAGGINDPRTHLSELHAPYTQKGWNGKQIDDVISGNWSLKAHGEESGLLLQTIPQTLRFQPGKTYKVSFKHESSGSDYALLIGDETTKKISVVINKAFEPTLTTFTFIASESGNSWFGIEKLNDKETDLIIDDLVIEEK